QLTTARGGGNLGGPSARSVLGVQLSASLRESLIGQMATINSADEAAAWAHRNLPAKNSLTAADAKIVEERFQAKLSTIDDREDVHGIAEGPISSGAPDGQGSDQDAVAQLSRESVSGPDASPSYKASTRVRKQYRSATVHALGKPVRLRDKDHRKFVL